MFQQSVFDLALGEMPMNEPSYPKAEPKKRQYGNWLEDQGEHPRRHGATVTVNHKEINHG